MKCQLASPAEEHAAQFLPVSSLRPSRRAARSRTLAVSLSWTNKTYPRHRSVLGEE